MTPQERLDAVLNFIFKHGQVGTYSGKAWVIDQVAQIAAGDQYGARVEAWKRQEESLDPWGSETTYTWDQGVKPSGI